jgi:guanylate kinase
MPKQTLGACVVVTGPSGSGKTTIVRRLIEMMPDSTRLITTTTRPPREGERDGIDYHFVTRRAFVASRERGEFLEWAENYGELYGSSKVELDKLRADHAYVFATVDVQGARAYRKNISDATLILCWAALSELERRLRSRPDMTEEKLGRRLAAAVDEVSFGEQCDYCVRCEGAIETTLSLFCSILAFA